MASKNDAALLLLLSLPTSTSYTLNVFVVADDTVRAIVFDAVDAAASLWYTIIASSNMPTRDASNDDIDEDDSDSNKDGDPSWPCP